MGLLKKMFMNVNSGKITFENFNPNNKKFGEQLLDYFQKITSENIGVNVKRGWIKKDDIFPIITITKGMDEIQKIEEIKIISFDFNIWTKNKKSRDIITKKSYAILESIDFEETHQPEISNVKKIDFEEKKGIYRGQFDLVMRVKLNISKKELKISKDYQKRSEHFEKLVLGESSFGGEFLESRNKKLNLFNPSVSRETLALIEGNKILWKKQFQNLVSFDFAGNGSYAVVITQLREKEMSTGYKSGGHIYVITKEGKLKDIKISCDGLSCSISSDNRFFCVTTTGPEWGIYYFNNKGNLLWKKRFDKRVGGIELTKNQIILYDKIHKETRKEIMRLDKKWERVRAY
jgi:hypothetical protein